MQIITITVAVENDEDVDLAHEMGITNEAFERLADMLSNEGYPVQGVKVLR